MDSNKSISITDMNKKTSTQNSQQRIQASRGGYGYSSYGNDYNVTCTPAHKIFYNKVKGYVPRYFNKCNTCVPNVKQCVPKQPVCVKPPIKPAKYSCPPVKKSCKPVFKKRCGLNGEICFGNGNKPECPNFEILLVDQAMRFSLLSSHIKRGDEERTNATIEAIEENADHWGNLLGPGFVPILHTQNDALINIGISRLGNGSTSIGGVDARQELLEDSQKILHSNRRAVILYFQSMPQICNNEMLACCIKKGWDMHIDLIISMFEGLEEENADPEAYDDSVILLSKDSEDFGQFLDKLCLKPKAPCPGEEEDTFVYRSSVKLNNKSAKGRTTTTNNNNQRGNRQQTNNNNTQQGRGRQTVISTTNNNNNNRQTNTLPISQDMASMKMMPSDFGAKDRVTIDYSTLAKFENIDTVIRSSEIIDAVAEVETGTIDNPTDLKKKDILAVNRPFVVIGVYEENGSKGEVIVFAQEPQDHTYVPFTIAGAGRFHFYLDFNLVWESHGDKSETMAEGSQTGTTECRFMGGNFAVHGMTNLSGKDIDGLYTSPSFNQNGVNYFVQVRIAKANVCSNNGPIDQHYGISYFSIVTQRN